MVARGVRHPDRPVTGNLLRFPDGHYTIRLTHGIVATCHGVDRRFGRRHEPALATNLSPAR